MVFPKSWQNVYGLRWLRNPGRMKYNPGSARNCPGVATPLARTSSWQSIFELVCSLAWKMKTAITNNLHDKIINIDSTYVCTSNLVAFYLDFSMQFFVVSCSPVASPWGEWVGLNPPLLFRPLTRFMKNCWKVYYWYRGGLPWMYHHHSLMSVFFQD